MSQQKEAAVLGMWAFLLTEILFFGGLFMAYMLYRTWYHDAFRVASSSITLFWGALNTVVLIASSLTMALGVRAAQTNKRQATVGWLLLTTLLGLVFLGVKVIEYADKFEHHHVPGPSFVWADPSHESASAVHSPIQDYLRELHARHAALREGQVATYIPELAKANPDWFGICLVTTGGHVYEAGDSRQPFTLQSISKPFVYGLALEDSQVVGMVTLRDLLGQPSYRPIREVMSRHVVTVPAAEPITSAFALMDQYRVDQLPVVEQGTLVGLITRSGLLHELGKLTDPLTELPWAGALRQQAANLAADHHREHQRQAVAVVVSGSDSIEPDGIVRAALAHALTGLLELPVTVRVVVDAQHIGHLRVGAEPLDVQIAHAVGAEPGVQRVMMID